VKVITIDKYEVTKGSLFVQNKKEEKQVYVNPSLSFKMASISSSTSKRIPPKKKLESKEEEEEELILPEEDDDDEEEVHLKHDESEDFHDPINPITSTKQPVSIVSSKQKTKTNKKKVSKKGKEEEEEEMELL
jgi:hypothetical protein